MIESEEQEAAYGRLSAGEAAALGALFVASAIASGAIAVAAWIRRRELHTPNNNSVRLNTWHELDLDLSDSVSEQGD